MKKFALGLFTACCLLSAGSVSAQSEEDNKKWMAHATPGEMQKMMASWDGEWDEDITMWMAPGAPEQKMQASCVNRMILDGRYQEAVHKGEFMGMPFHGLGMLAWDNTLKIFVNTWVDNFGTGMMYLTGTWNEKNKSMELKGTMTDPIAGKPIPVRQVLKIVDDKTQILEQYNSHEGKEFMGMKITLTRKG